MLQAESCTNLVMRDSLHGAGGLACLVPGESQRILQLGQLLGVDQYGCGLAVVGDGDAFPRVGGSADERAEAGAGFSDRQCVTHV